MDNRDNRPAGLYQYHPDLITHQDPMSQVSECFKIARTNIEFSALGEKLKTIVVTSSNQSEGKSLTIANLAIAYAQIGRRVLLIDADLRRPTQHRLFGLSNRRGLTNALLADGDISSLAQPTQTENLALLTSGPTPPNPAELLMNVSLEKVIAAACEQYDLVLIDCAPVGIVTDAAIVATRVDGVLFVVRAGGVNKNQLKRAATLLNQVKAHVLGYVMNGINETSDDYYYYYYYYHQGYYNTEDQDSSKKTRKHKHHKKATGPESYPARQQAFIQRQQLQDQNQPPPAGKARYSRTDIPEPRLRKVTEAPVPSFSEGRSSEGRFSESRGSENRSSDNRSSEARYNEYRSMPPGPGPQQPASVAGVTARGLVSEDD